MSGWRPLSVHGRSSTGHFCEQIPTDNENSHETLADLVFVFSGLEESALRKSACSLFHLFVRPSRRICLRRMDFEVS